MKLFLLSFLLLFLSSTSISFAQRDTVFWFAAPEVSSGAGDSPVLLRFQSYAQPATITVSQPANGSFVPMTLNLVPNATGTINLTPFLSSIESPVANAASNNGLKITATNKVNAAYEVNAVNNKETFSLKGGKALGTDFYIPAQKFWTTSTTTPASYSGVEIVATENNTTVLITPRTDITGHLANVTFSIVLNAGQTYSMRDMNVTPASSLAGSIVSSNKPIAVTIVDTQLDQSSCADMIGDQLIPSQHLGNNYVIYKGTSNTDRVYILGTQNSSALEITGSGVINAMINTGETYEVPITDNIVYIKSTKPVYVYHVSGFNCELSASIIPSIDCKGNNSMSFTRTSTDSLGLILVTRAGFEGDFLLNGSPSLVTPASFNIVPGTSGVYTAARIFFNTTDVPVGTPMMLTNSSDIFTMGVISGGAANTGASYVFTTDYYATANSFAGLDDSVCANVSYALNGNVGGGAVTGVWSTNGYGTFQNGSTSIPNTYIPSQLDTLISPIRLILTSTGFCPSVKDTLILTVTPAPIVNANVDQSVCKNNAVIQLNGIVSGGASTGVWSTVGTGSFVPNTTTLNAQYVPSAADLAAGQVKFALTSSNSGNCAAASDTMVVTFTNAAVVNAGPDTITVCANNSIVNLNGSVTGLTNTGKWTSTGSGIFSPNNSTLNATYTPSIADTTAGFVWIYLESTSNGNCIPVMDSVYINISNAPKANAGVNQLVCTNNANIQLNGSVLGGSFGGQWSGGAGTFTPSSTSMNAVYVPTATEISNGNVVLTLTSTNNGTCLQASDAMQIVFVAPPFSNFSATTVCEGFQTAFTNFSLAGSGTITATNWLFETGQTSSSFNTSYTYPTAGTYPVQLITTNSNSCTDTTTINVIVHDKPVADYTISKSCPNNQMTVTFTDASTCADPLNYWFYDFGGPGSGASSSLSQVFTSGGTYTITHIVSSTFGCKDTLVNQLVVDPLPDAGFYYNSAAGMNVGAVFNFIDTSDYAVNYSWDFGDGGTSTSMNPSHTFFANGNYYVLLEVQNSLGCMDSAFQYILINTVTTEISTLIPTVISPNGDGLNDVWKLDFLQLLYPNAHVEIYNEWGQTLFTSDGYATPWDGTYNNQPVPDGNYMYVIQLNANADPDIFKGVLMVLRKR